MEKHKEIAKRKSEKVSVLVRLVVTDKDGKVISDTGEKKSKSLVIAFLRMIYGYFRGWDVSTPDTSNNNTLIVDIDRAGECGSVKANINDSTFGIVVGTGTTARTNSDYKLATQLTEGIGAGQITHGASSIYALASIVGANVDVVLLRSFTNMTGSTITAKEVGVYIQTYWISTSRYYCIISDLLSPTIDIPNLCSLTVYYTVRTTV